MTQPARTGLLSARLTRPAIAALSAVALVVAPASALGSPARASGTTVTVTYDPQTMAYRLAPQSIQRSAGETFTLANTMRSAENRPTVYVSITNGTGSASMNGTACERISSCKVLDLYDGSATGTVTVIQPGTFTITRVLRDYVGSEAPPITIGTLTVDGDEPVTQSIRITDSGRSTVSGKPGIFIEGLAEGLSGNAKIRVWLRFPGQTEYTESSAQPQVDSLGNFGWQRKTGKKAYIYVTSLNGEIKSNRVIIPAN